MTQNAENQPGGQSPEQGDTYRRRSRGGIAFAVVIILVGIIFLLQNLDVIGFGNWWALFILIPAGVSFGSAWDEYKGAGRLTRSVAGPLSSGCLILFVALIFLFDWPWDKIWPVFIIIIGLGLMLGWRSK